MLLIWDGNNLFRRFLAAPRFATLTSSTGKPSGGLYGTVNTILHHLDRWRPTHCVVAFDGHLAKGQKQQQFAGYKAHRASAGKLLSDKWVESHEGSHSLTAQEHEQMSELISLLRFLGLKVFHEPNLDADDIIGTVAKANCAKSTIIVSNDKDFMQLLDSRTWQLRDESLYGPAEVKHIFGVKPRQIADYLALCGDAVDGIPGLQGCGPKTAAALLSQYGTLKGIAQSDSPWAAKLRENKNAIITYRGLTKINTSVLPAKEKHSLKTTAVPKRYVQPELGKMIERYGLGQLRAWVESHPNTVLNHSNELF